MRLATTLLFIGCSLFCTALLGQQVRFGLRAGLSSAAQPSLSEEIESSSATYRISVDDIPLGYHVGVVLQARAKHWVFQPEVLLHSTRTDYRLEEIVNGQVFESVREERFSHLEVPLLVAYRWGPLRLQVGPTARMLLASSSQFTGVNSYVDLAQDFTIGYQAGVGLDIRRVLFDVKFDGSLQGLGSNIELGGEQLAFNNAAGRTYATVGILLF